MEARFGEAFDSRVSGLGGGVRNLETQFVDARVPVSKDLLANVGILLRTILAVFFRPGPRREP